jgi:glucose/arabinose dehydrogenase
VNSASKALMTLSGCLVLVGTIACENKSAGGGTAAGGAGTGLVAGAGQPMGTAGAGGVGAGGTTGGTLTGGAGGSMASSGGTGGQPEVSCVAVPKMKLTLTTRVPIAPFANDEEWMAAPLALVQAKGDDRIFIAQRGGRILILKNGSLLPEPFFDMRTSISDVPWGHRGERGLLNIALHPDFATNGRFYVYYTGNDNDPYSDAIDGDVVVAEGTQSTANPNKANASLKPLLVLPHGGNYDDGHNGGLLAFGKDGELWTAVGDGGNGWDYFKTGQDPNHHLAKLYRLDTDKPPANPRTNSKDAVWSMGHRNPFRGSVDLETGDLYIGDIQEQHWEEINIVPYKTPKGTTNYGWGSTNQEPQPRTSCKGQAGCPVVWPKAGMEGTHCFPSYFTDADVECVRFGVPPVFEYPHKDTGNLSTPRDNTPPVAVTEVAAVIGGFVYRGSKIPGMKGRYIFGDYPNKWIKSFVTRNGKAECVEDHTADLALSTMLKGGLVGFGADAEGELYLLDRDQTHLSGSANKGEGRNVYKLEAE